jgi:hypothetical protein
MKKLLLCLVALFAAIGAQASSETITKGEGTSGTSTVKFSATDKPDITAKAVYTLTLNADNKLEVELTFADLNNSDVEGLGNDPCYMFIDGIGETSLSYADGKYTGTTAGAATPGNFYSNCYFKRACANTGANYGENGQLIFPFEFTAPSAAAESELNGTSDKNVPMDFIEVNVSDLSALFKLKVQLIDNNQSKEYIHMYLRKANETPEATADDPYAKYGEEKGTPALDPRSNKEGSNIENPIFFNYTELEKNTDYIATAVVKKEGYTGVTEYPFTTLDHAEGTTSYIENGYFQDGENVLTQLPDGTKKRLVYLASARYTFTYDKDNGELYLTFDTRIRNDHKLPVLQSKYELRVDGRNDPYYGDPNTVAGYKDHYSFVINNQCEDIATLIENKTPLHFTYSTDYENGGKSYFNGFDYDGSTSSDDFGEPADVQWIDYSYKDQQEQNKNRYDLYKLLPKTQLMATVVDADGHYLPRKIVKFEMATNDSGKATVTCDTSLGQPKWFVEATSLADATNTAVDFEVVAYHELETEAAPAGAPRRVLNADKNRLEAKRGFHYVESDTATGIDDIEADDANAPVRYFDLNGREISEPQKGMFVIRLQGSKATKMIAE